MKITFRLSCDHDKYLSTTEFVVDGDESKLLVSPATVIGVIAQAYENNGGKVLVTGHSTFRADSEVAR